MKKQYSSLLVIFLLAIFLMAPMVTPTKSHASEPFIGEIMMVGFNFAPRGWATCDGQLLPIAQNTALFSLLGTTFGGDGRTTFALPDLRGRVAIHVGDGAGLAPVSWGQRGGVETVVLTTANIPAHSHAATLKATDNYGNNEDPTDRIHAVKRRDKDFSNVAPNVNMSTTSIEVANTGGGQGFNIKNPFLGIYHVIALQGLFPSRS